MVKYTEELHNRLRELHQNASPTPWDTSTTGRQAEIVDEDDDLVLELGYAPSMDVQMKNDALLVVETINVLPALLDEIERLQNKLETSQTEA